MDVATLRSDFPEFADVLAYPDSQVNFWLGIGQKMLRPEAWDDLLNHGLELFTAHHLSLARQNQKTALKGGAVGANSGVLSAKSVDRVSGAYDTSASTIEGQGHWNLTTYGTQFIQLSKMVGMGGVQAYGGALSDVPALAQWQDGLPRYP